MSPVLDARNTTNAPTDSEIVFLVLPPLDKCDAYQAVHYGVDWREVTEEKVGGDSEGSDADKGSEVELSEGEIEGYSLTEAIADVVQILDF